MKNLLRCLTAWHLLVLVVLFWGTNPAQAQPPLYRIGAPYPPVRDPRLTTDNGIPGSGSYYFRDYPWPSLREALQQYGFFGRRYRANKAAAAPVCGQPPRPYER